MFTKDHYQNRRTTHRNGCSLEDLVRKCTSVRRCLRDFYTEKSHSFSWSILVVLFAKNGFYLIFCLWINILVTRCIWLFRIENFRKLNYVKSFAVPKRNLHTLSLSVFSRQTSAECCQSPSRWLAPFLPRKPPPIFACFPSFPSKISSRNREYIRKLAFNKKFLALKLAFIQKLSLISGKMSFTIWLAE